MRFGGLVVAACVSSQLAACEGAPTVIDGSSTATFEQSAAAARRDLPVADRLAFDSALKNPPGRRYGQSEEDIVRLARTTYDGMTANDVLEVTR